MLGDIQRKLKERETQTKQDSEHPPRLL
jgi:hypothetical protein